MVFNSFNFWLLFPFIFIIYWIIPSKNNEIRKVFLIIVSYLLYMNWMPVYALVLLGVTLVTFGGGYLIGIQCVKSKTILIWSFILIALLPLLLFKYYNFLNNSITEGLELCGLRFSLPGLNWAIPVGISFFTFQAVGYLLDVYHKRIKPEKNIVDYLLFICFFPQVASGPISKADELLPQIKGVHFFLFEKAKDGLKMILWGMFLKCVVADRLGLYVDTVYSNYEHFSGLNCFIASVFYTIQIYGDFAGYSLMAIGIAKTLGFDLIDNFRRPYLSSSITEFWRRWHISLTRWLTSHIYINLGGSHCSKIKQYWNILITFLVSGLWHGANWTFVIWGAIHGLLQIVEKALGIDPKGKHYDHIEKIRPLKPFRMCISFLLVSFAWIFFRMPSLNDAMSFIGRIFTRNIQQPFLYKATNSDVLFMVTSILILLCAELWQEYYHDRIKILRNKYVRLAIYVCLFSMILCIGVLDASSFIYVSF